ncbi:MAG: hypothetical protein IJE66_08070 [Akkermansia sp.]|nr:hypothetical protein [Akkermansia sp.]
MKKSLCIVTVAAASLMLASCESMGTLGRVNSNQANVATASYPATVVSVTNTTIDTSSTARNLGTIVGGALGAGAGQMLGGGSGRIVSAVGFGAAGALAGRYVTDAAGKTAGQTVTVQVDGSKQMYTVTQPVYEEVGYISVGMRGIFHLGGNNSRFVPY